MKEVVLAIPNFRTMHLHHLVLDFNGTVALEGELLPEVSALLPDLSARYSVHVITSDTFGTVRAQLEGFDVRVTVLQSNDHTMEKALYLDKLGVQHCIAVGNGSNDARMLKDARLAIAVIGEEGCSIPALTNADIVCNSIGNALELLLSNKRLIATLRR